MSQITNPTNRQPFDLIDEMEGPLSDINNLLTAMMMMADQADETEGSAMHCVARLAHAQCIAAEKIRTRLFKLMHPHRHQLAAEGRWPE